MTTTTISRTHRAAAAAIALSMFGAVSLAGVPMAAGQALGDQRDVAEVIVDIDQGRTATLNIEKYLGDPGDTTTPYEGSEFVIRPIVGPDPATPWSPRNVEDWQAFADLKIEDVDPDMLGAEVGRKTSDAAGKATFEGLPLGFYYVEEVPDPDKPQRTTIAPFIVALPSTSDSDDGDIWQYETTVQPKNQMLNIEKAVDDKESHAESLGPTGTHHYSLELDLPPVPADRNYANLTIFDDYDETAVGFGGYPRDSVQLEMTGDEAPEFKSRTDFTVTITDGGTNGGPERIRIDLTEAGLEKISAHKRDNPGAVLKVDLAMQVLNGNFDGETPGTITNQASFIPPNNGFGDAELAEIPSNEVESKYGRIQVTKVNQSKEPLEGAEFALHYCTAEGTAVDKVPEQGPLVTPLNVTSETSADGTLVFEGIKLITHYNMEPQENLDGSVVTQYCLVETQAPDGYELQPKPIPIDNDELATGAMVEIEVINVADNGGFQLPVTGANTIPLLIGAGGLLAAGAAALAYKKRRDDRAVNATAE